MTQQRSKSASLTARIDTLGPALAWEFARGIDVLGAVHLDLPQPRLYVRLPYALRADIQQAIRLPVARVVANPSDLAAWHILFLFPLWCLALPAARP